MAVPATSIADHHARTVLMARAVDPAHAAKLGTFSVSTAAELPADFRDMRYANVPGLVFTWHSPTKGDVLQYRPDEPVVNKQGDPVKYVFAAGTEMVLSRLREPSKAMDGPMILQEGTCQSLAVARYAPDGWAVYGMSGCWNWRKGDTQVAIPDLMVTEGREVYISLDADAATNRNVYDAGMALKSALLAEGAHSVKFVRLVGHGKKAGIDDVLAQRPEDKRAAYVARLLDNAADKPADARPPAGRSAVKAGLTVDRSGERPLIVTSEDKLAVIDACEKALREKWDGSRLFAHGGILSWREDRRMEPVTDGNLVDLLATAAQTVALNGKGDYVSSWPDEPTRKALLTSRRKNFTPLERVTETPFVRPDGSICQASGYDEATATFLVLDEAAERVQVPEEPGEEDVRAAVKLLCDDWLGDLMESMPEQADRANCLALVLTPLVRALVPLAPLAVIDGLQMGVGKNLLADVVAIFATGRSAHPLPFSSEDEENRKLITSVFRGGADVFVFDEAHVIGGRQLARAITSETYTDRVLGVSQMAEFPNRTTWLALGNNVTVEGDLARRVYRIRLAPDGADPQDRDSEGFRHPDLKEWTIQNRAELLAAGLTIVRAWMAGRREMSVAGRSFGSFERWGGMVGGMLEAAGVPGFLTNLRAWRTEADYDSAYWGQHLRWLSDQFGGSDFAVAEVIEKMRRARPGTVEHPPRLLDHDDRNYNRQLGQSYGRAKGRSFGGLKLVKLPGGMAGNRWQVITQGDAGVSTASPTGPDTEGDDVTTPEPGHSSDSSDRVATYAKRNPSPREGSRLDVSREHVTEELGGYPSYPSYPSDPADPAGLAALTRFVTERAVEVAARICPDCDREEKPVPPVGLWHACPECHPESFTRSWLECV